MTRFVLRLIADDLTGALDSAAELTGLCGPVPLPVITKSKVPSSASLVVKLTIAACVPTADGS